MLGQQGVYLAQVYMLTPAVAAILSRLFFYKGRFGDANLRFGRIRDYLKFWLISIGITLLSYLLFTVLGSVSWDFSGGVFLERLAEQFEMAGQDINAGLPPGFTPQIMLFIYFIGGLTLFNILPGIITGFGEEFGHRGFMFPLLYQIKPWVGFLVGGSIWFAWHLPLAFVIPQTVDYTFWQTALNFFILATGSICTHTYLAYAYVKSKNIWVASIAHISMNNAAASFSYFAVVQNQLLANLGLTLTVLIVIVVLYYRQEFNIFADQRTESKPAEGTDRLK
jgi:membrane protease YdiL (CAAX protease family)